MHVETVQTMYERSRPLGDDISRLPAVTEAPK